MSEPASAPDGLRLPWPLLVLLVLALGAAVFLPELGTAPLTRAEIYFLDGARGMVESGDYLVPRYRGEPFFDKPVLAYWLMAGAFRLLGFGAGAARTVPAVAGLAVLAATAWLGALLVGRRAAVAGALVLGTTLSFMSFGRVAMSDMLLALWTVLSFGLAVLAFRRGGDVPTLAALGLTLGLGFQTKGPVALLLPGLGLLLLAWRERARLPRPRPAGLAAAALLFAVAGLGWFLAVYHRLGAGPLEYFFLRENLERFAGATYDAGQPIWFYVPAYLAGGLPWSLFLPGALTRLLGRSGGESWRPGVRLLLGWAGLMLVPLTLARGKLDYYLLPVLPAVSLALGTYFVEAGWRRLDRAWSGTALFLLAGSAAVLPWALTRFPAEWLPPHAQVLGLTALAAGCSTVLAFGAARPRPRGAILSVAGVSAALFASLAALTLPPFVRAQPNAGIVEDVLRERAYRPDLSLAACEDPTRAERDVLFQARLAARLRCDLWAPAASDSPYLLLLEPNEGDSLLRIEGLRVVSRRPYLPASALTLRGLLRGPQPSVLTLAANFETDEPLAVRKRLRERRKAIRAEEDALAAARAAAIEKRRREKAAARALREAGR